MQIGFWNKILRVSGLIHTDGDISVGVYGVSEFHAKEVCDFWLEINFIYVPEVGLEFLFDFVACAEVDEIIDE